MNFYGLLATVQAAAAVICDSQIGATAALVLALLSVASAINNKENK